MLGDSRPSALLHGFRGAGRGRGTAGRVSAISEFAHDQHDRIAELDVNPLDLRGERIIAVDALIAKSDRRHDDTPPCPVSPAGAVPWPSCRAASWPTRSTTQGRPPSIPRVVAPAAVQRPASAGSRSRGLGTVYATTVIAPAASRLQRGLIDMDEGFRLMSRVEDIDPMRCASACACSVRVHPARRRAAALPCLRPGGGRS